MESKLYEQSLSLFNKGEYEEVLKIFRHTTVVLSEKEKILLRESRKQVTEQYLFLIKDYIQEKEYIKAEELQKHIEKRMEEMKKEGVFPGAGKGPREEGRRKTA